MTVLRVAVMFLFACTCAAYAAVLAVVALVLFGGPTYDRTHPSYASFAARFAEAQRALDAGQPWAVIDLADFNGGSWRTACVFGGYTRPIQHMEALGAAISDADRRRLGEPTGLRLYPVEENELLIAYTDEQGRANFVHFNRGVGTDGQLQDSCVTRPVTQVAAKTGTRLQPPVPLAKREDRR